jgi:hypothetical protein
MAPKCEGQIAPLELDVGRRCGVGKIDQGGTKPKSRPMDNGPERED